MNASNYSESCIICCNKLDETVDFGTKDEKTKKLPDPIYLGRTVKITCCNELIHEKCLHGAVNYQADPHRYNNLTASTERYIRATGLTVEEVTANNDKDNTSKLGLCPFCRYKTKSYLLYNPESDKDDLFGIDNINYEMSQAQVRPKLKAEIEEIKHKADEQAKREAEFKKMVTNVDNNYLNQGSGKVNFSGLTFRGNTIKKI